MSTHVCHAFHCNVPVQRKMFMCKTHWYMLPKRMRDAIWSTYTLGQERDPDKIKLEYFDATREAINYIRDYEDKNGGGKLI